MSSRHRDRRGRGLRGTLAPPDAPLSRSRSERFDELVLDALEDVEETWGEALSGVELAVEEVPPPPPGALPLTAATGPSRRPVPLGRAVPARPGRPARLVVYRRPVEGRASGHRATESLLHDVLVELVADLLGIEPETVDPDYPEHEGWG